MGGRSERQLNSLHSMRLTAKYTVNRMRDSCGRSVRMSRTRPKRVTFVSAGIFLVYASDLPLLLFD